MIVPIWSPVLKTIEPYAGIQLLERYLLWCWVFPFFFFHFIIIFLPVLVHIFVFNFYFLFCVTHLVAILAASMSGSMLFWQFPFTYVCHRLFVNCLLGPTGILMYIGTPRYLELYQHLHLMERLASTMLRYFFPFLPCLKVHIWLHLVEGFIISIRE